jgi:hypothetical protein
VSFVEKERYVNSKISGANNKNQEHDLPPVHGWEIVYSPALQADYKGLVWRIDLKNIIGNFKDFHS